ncbi:hypothetical protein WJX74_007263 [Apatococcus lobatus]|uniref:Serine protease n=1 Tax=Apatococcus lobatus TaxID=904363 RepID=A0AAW1QTV4_9CHLO
MALSSFSIKAVQVMRPYALAAILVVSTSLSHLAWADDHTHIDNHSKKWTILATTRYPGGHSSFVKRSIPPGGSDVDEYNFVDHVDITVQVEGAPFSNWFKIYSDDSVVAEDTPGNKYGVDFWLNDGNGKPVKTARDSAGNIVATPPLVTIFGPGPPPTPSPTPTPAPTPPPTLEPLGDEDTCNDPENGYSPSTPDVNVQRALDHRIPAWEGSSTATFPAIGLVFKSKAVISSCAYGSAFAVGPKHIVTAAHMLYNRTEKKDIKPKHIDFGKVGKKDHGVAGGYHIKVKNCKVPEGFKTVPDDQRHRVDFGACLVDTLPATVGYMNMVVPPSGSNTISTAGYPLEAPWPLDFTEDTAIQKPFMTTERATITDDLIQFKSLGSRGQSGSPFFAAAGTEGHPVRPASPARPDAFGVLIETSQTQVLGVPLTQQRINTIRGWMDNELKP